MKKKPAHYQGDRSWQAIRRYWRLKMLLNESTKSAGKAESRLRNAVARKAELNEQLESAVVDGNFSAYRCNELKEKLETVNKSFGALEADLNRCEAKVAGWKRDLNSCIQQLLGLKSVLVITNFDYTAFMEMRELHGYAGKMVVTPTKRSEGFRKKLDKDRIPYAMAD